MYDIPAMVRAVSDAFSSLFNWRTSSVEKIESKEIISDKRDLERACGYAEEAIMLVNRYAQWDDSAKYVKIYRNKVEKFRKYRNRG